MAWWWSLVHDVIVVGAGPAGIAAATEAAEAGLDVVLVDSAPRPGGQIWRHTTRSTLPQRARVWLNRLDQSGAQVCTSTMVIDAQRDGGSGFAVSIASTHDEIIHTSAIVLATGARELFLPFPGWTLPGVMGVGGVQALLKSGAHLARKRIVLAGSGPLMLPVAAALTDAGAHVTHVLEQADTTKVASFAAGLWRTPDRLLLAMRFRARALATSWRTGMWVTQAAGADRVTHAVITDGRTTRKLPCDVLAVGYGLVPATEAASLLGCATGPGGVVVDEMQRTSVAGVYCIGETTGIAGADGAIIEGRIAAHALTDARTNARNGAAARRRAELQGLFDALEDERRFASAMSRTFALRQELARLALDDTIVCRCEDVTLGAVRTCASMREAKLHTRAGMGACQGRVCGPALQHLLGWDPDAVRPPLFPATVHALLAKQQSAIPS